MYAGMPFAAILCSTFTGLRACQYLPSYALAPPLSVCAVNFASKFARSFRWSTSAGRLASSVAGFCNPSSSGPTVFSPPVSAR